MEEEVYYTVSEMAAQFGLTRQTLIYYDRIGLFRPASVSGAGYRLYAPTQIPALRLICLLRELGLPLDDIREVAGEHGAASQLERLPRQRAKLDARIAELMGQRTFIDERIAFYREVAWWQEREGEPCLRRYGERRVLFEPFGLPAAEVGHDVLHATLMRLIRRLQEERGVGPVSGFGTMLPARGLAGAGSFVTLPEGVRAEGEIVLPAGEYACLARWGMPYDLRGIEALLAWARGQGVGLAADAFDFCLLDETSYGAGHSEDFCCVQVRVCDKGTVPLSHKGGMGVTKGLSLCHITGGETL